MSLIAQPLSMKVFSIFFFVKFIFIRTLKQQDGYCLLGHFKFQVIAFLLASVTEMPDLLQKASNNNICKQEKRRNHCSSNFVISLMEFISPERRRMSLVQKSRHDEMALQKDISEIFSCKYSKIIMFQLTIYFYLICNSLLVKHCLFLNSNVQLIQTKAKLL